MATVPLRIRAAGLIAGKKPRPARVTTVEPVCGALAGRKQLRAGRSTEKSLVAVQPSSLRLRVATQFAKFGLLENVAEIFSPIADAEDQPDKALGAVEKDRNRVVPAQEKALCEITVTETAPVNEPTFTLVHEETALLSNVRNLLKEAFCCPDDATMEILVGTTAEPVRRRNDVDDQRVDAAEADPPMRKHSEERNCKAEMKIRTPTLAVEGVLSGVEEETASLSKLN